MNLEKEEMLNKFVEAQNEYPSRDDWTLQVADDLKEFGIPGNFEYMRSKSSISFKHLVRIKAKEYALKYLLNMKQEHSKMDDLVYNELKLQPYLKAKNIPVHEAKNLFKYRVKVANFKENYRERYKDTVTVCPLCTIHLDTQAHALQCPEIKAKIKIEGNYHDIFKNKIPSEISKTLFKISPIRKDIEE